jgi:GAF domain-containing protein
MTVDGQVVALAIRELRAMLPKTGGLLAPFQRVVEATRTVVGADGAGLTLAHEDHQPRWVATTDAAMELLEQIQHDFGEGPCLQAYSQDQAVAVADLRAAPVWARIDAVVGQLHVRGVLSVPVRLAGQPVGTLDLYSTRPRAWTAHELEAMAEFATVAGELAHTAVELATRELGRGPRPGRRTGPGGRPGRPDPPPRRPGPGPGRRRRARPPRRRAQPCR